jgi:hypothetical protein
VRKKVELHGWAFLSSQDAEMDKFRELFPSAHTDQMVELLYYAEKPESVFEKIELPSCGLLKLYAVYPDAVLEFLQFARERLKRKSPIQEFIRKALSKGVKLETGKTVEIDEASDKEIAQAIERESNVRVSEAAVKKERQRLATQARLNRLYPTHSPKKQRELERYDAKLEREIERLERLEKRKGQQK